MILCSSDVCIHTISICRTNHTTNMAAMGSSCFVLASLIEIWQEAPMESYVKSFLKAK